MLLQRFSYYFSVKGNKGGLFSLEFLFLPEIPDSEPADAEAVREALKREFSLEKRGADAHPAKLWLKLTLGHRLNLSALETVLGLPELTISQEAARELENLRQIASHHEAPDPIRLLSAS